MTLYTPDRWLVIKIDVPEAPVFKVFGTWSGGYLYGDSWRTNSGITDVAVSGDFVYFQGATGSVYRVHRLMYGATAYSHSVLQSMIDTAPVPVETLPENFDWLSLNELVAR